MFRTIAYIGLLIQGWQLGLIPLIPADKVEINGPVHMFRTISYWAWGGGKGFQRYKTLLNYKFKIGHKRYYKFIFGIPLFIGFFFSGK